MNAEQVRELDAQLQPAVDLFERIDPKAAKDLRRKLAVLAAVAAGHNRLPAIITASKLAKNVAYRHVTALTRSGVLTYSRPAGWLLAEAPAPAPAPAAVEELDAEHERQVRERNAKRERRKQERLRAVQSAPRCSCPVPIDDGEGDCCRCGRGLPVDDRQAVAA